MKLKSATRNALPKSSFGLPKERKYPMEDPDKIVTKGKLSPASAAKIRAKANRLLGNG